MKREKVAQQFGTQHHFDSNNKCWEKKKKPFNFWYNFLLLELNLSPHTDFNIEKWNGAWHTSQSIVKLI